MLLLLLLLSLEGSQSQGDSYELKVPPLWMVQEGLCTYIPCTFNYPYSSVKFLAIHGYWFRKGPSNSEDVLVATNEQNIEVEKEAVGRFHLVGDLKKKNCSLYVTDIQTKDTGYYFFCMERTFQKHSYLNYQVKLDVTALTQKPDIYIPEILEPGHPVSLMCAAPWVCENGTPPTFSWREAALSSLGPNRRTTYFSELTLTPRSEDHGSNLTCQMTFPGSGAHTETTVQLNVAYPIKTFGISIDWEKERGLKSSLNHSILKDASLRLLCQADSNPPAILSWSHGGQVVLSSCPSSTGILALQLPRLGVKDGGEYRCQAQYRMETQYATLNLSVIYAPENLKVRVFWPNRTRTGRVASLENASSLVLLMGESLQLECTADSSPHANMSWVKGSQVLNSSPLSNAGIQCLELIHVQPEDGGEYTCHAQNEWGTQHISLNLFVQYRARAASLSFSKGAILGTGITALLILCSKLAYKKFLRRKQIETEELEVRDSQNNMEMDYVNVNVNQNRPPPPDAVTQDPPDELHYASLNFRRPNPKNQGTHTEYGEIKFCSGDKEGGTNSDMG
ncbi:sialic acid-binding Ig-like lectin 13 isoform X2 [Macrotis lagotis]|uniref:sialic acid-binding Ig-like lectin 13 isoform X2 n=1 Tax=Macrotis lagotis TaxID=92651 RepID=UPI003D692B3B